MCVIDRRPNTSKACVQRSFLYRFPLLYCAGAHRFCLTIYWIFSISIHNTSERRRERKKTQCICFISQLCNTLLYSCRLIYNLSTKSFWLDLSPSRHSRIQWLCKLHYITRVSSVILMQERFMEMHLLIRNFWFRKDFFYGHNSRIF